MQHLGHDSILAGRGRARPCPIRSKKVEELAREAERGKSERTPWLALSAVQIAVAAAVAVVLAIAFAAYLLA